MFEPTKRAAKPTSSLSGQPGNGGGISKRREWGEKMPDSASGMELINLLAMEGNCERSPQRYFNERNLSEKYSLFIYAWKGNERASYKIDNGNK